MSDKAARITFLEHAEPGLYNGVPWCAGCNAGRVAPEIGRDAIVARIWHGYTRPEDADGYEAKLKPEMLPGIGKVPGYRGGYALRRDLENELEFITIMIWESIDAIKAVAGAKLHGLDHPPRIG